MKTNQFNKFYVTTVLKFCRMDVLVVVVLHSQSIDMGSIPGHTPRAEFFVCPFCLFAQISKNNLTVLKFQSLVDR
jgi:hypothetical protein